MSFSHPRVLWFLLLLPVLVVFSIVRLSSMRKKMPQSLFRRCIASSFFFGLFLACFIFALASVQQGQNRTVQGGSRAADLVIALDLSRSMDIRDMAGSKVLGSGEMQSRLRHGISICLDAVTALPDMRYAAAAGRSKAVLAVPLTPDINSLVSFLNAIDADMLTGRGTNLESLLDAAASAFQDSSPARRVILLVSDGESLSGNFRAAVERCRQKGISIIALVTGSDFGQPVPGHEDLISSPNKNNMRMASDSTGGLYVDAGSPDAASITGFLRTRAPSRASTASEGTSRWFLFIIIAIVCYGTSKIIMLNPGKSRKEIHNG